MSLPPKQFVRLFDQRYRSPSGARLNYAIVGFLPLSIGAHMQALCPNIRLGEDYARKLILKHELKWDDLIAIEDLVADAYCFREKAHHRTFMGYSPSREGRAYSLVLKAAARGTETWVVTLHRTNEQQIRSKVERARAANRLLRTLDHPFEE